MPKIVFEKGQNLPDITFTPTIHLEDAGEYSYWEIDDTQYSPEDLAVIEAYIIGLNPELKKKLIQ